MDELFAAAEAGQVWDTTDASITELFTEFDLGAWERNFEAMGYALL